ncbi:NAD(P)/FAD-dependent oxidoreductase [Isachenkonia alkalipeptolytica]|uniref:NAD(P)/FAD-dependent oxidoreductase n=1 Tax=Isachenkonia alkalipeptolytica TaxID=2565777 RepID=A0AA43XIX3_9CLOT|nr:NAD(P)/FAD-dependent oxidoreductase [Isachenkonia alkalipeptolytica]NBG87126.1 NAD(P)/FAD-dependent oxidoreductase [Isachenkonia alkalipeptolytica]
MYDVAIIGGGVVGASIARELSKYHGKIVLIEKERDVSLGATKANSGIVHGVYATEYGTLKGRLAAKGSPMFQQLNKELNFGYRKTGSLVVGFNEADHRKIQKLYYNGKKYGENDQDLQLIGAETINKLEPHINGDVKMALHSKNVGVASPYEMTIALMENALANGVKVFFGQEINKIYRRENDFKIQGENQTFEAKYIVNAAGLYSDRVARMAGIEDYEIIPRRGQYILFGKDQGHLVNRVIFQVPNEKGKGILVTTTFHGNFMIGPNAEEVNDRADVSTTKESLKYIIQNARRSISDFKLNRAITTYSGIRASVKEKDFIIEGDRVKGMINLIGIDSPGLTAAPAIGEMVREMLKERGLILNKKTEFQPYRAPLFHKKEEDFEGSTDHQEPEKKVICRCETVTEEEITESFRRGLPVESIQAVKFRTRAGMGQCQGAYCRSRVKEIIRREQGGYKENIPMTSHREEPKVHKVDIKKIRKMDV